MAEEMIEKLEMLKDIIGSREGYLEATRTLNLNKEEKDIFMRASLEVNKSEPNFDIIDQAHAILMSKSSKDDSTVEDIVSDEPTVSEPVKHTGATLKSNNAHQFCTSCGNKLDVGAQFCSKCGTAIPKGATRTSSHPDDKNTDKATTNNEHHINKPKPSAPYNSRDRYKKPRDATKNTIHTSSQSKPMERKKVLFTILLIVGAIMLFMATMNTIIDNDPDVRIERYSKNNDLSYSEKNALSRTAWAMNSDTYERQKGENIALFDKMILILIFIGIPVLIYIWKVPRKDSSFIQGKSVVSLASAWKRIISFLIDVLVVFLPSILIMRVSLMFNMLDQVFIFYLPYLMLGVYFAYRLDGNDGQAETVGQKVMNIKIIREDGEPIGVIKYSLYSVFGIIFLFPLSILYFLNEKRKLLHNNATKTIVVEGNLS